MGNKYSWSAFVALNGTALPMFSASHRDQWIEIIRMDREVSSKPHLLLTATAIYLCDGLLSSVESISKCAYMSGQTLPDLKESLIELVENGYIEVSSD